MKESDARMEKIRYTMVLHQHVDWLDTKFYTMSGPLVNNHLGKYLGLIGRYSYQTAAEDIRLAYTNQCLTCGQIYILIFALVFMIQVMKEANISRTLRIGNNKLYQIHIGTQGGSL